MKIIQSSFFRAFCAVVVGVLIIMYHEVAIKGMSIAIGVLFFLSGIVSCAAYYVAKKRVKNDKETQATIDKTDENNEVVDEASAHIVTPKPTFPIVGVGSIILGAILALMPTSFADGMLYTLAAILILGAINQIVSVASVAKFTHVGLFYWLMPMIILLASILAILRPWNLAPYALQIVGWDMILYGVVECINAIKIGIARKKKAANDAKMLEKQQQMELNNSAQEAENEEVIVDNSSSETDDVHTNTSEYTNSSYDVQEEP